MVGYDSNIVVTQASSNILRVGCGSWETLTLAPTFVISKSITAEAGAPDN
jgi:hypothetical protein